MIKTNTKILLTLAVTCIAFAFPMFSKAVDVNYILSDYDLVKQSMTRSEIQNFLNAYDSCLADYSANGHSAAWMIYNYSKIHSINPQVALATLQKEQSLITSTSCSASRLAWAMGWGDRSNFANQIEMGIRQFRRYLSYPENYTFQVGKTSTVDGSVKVKPDNAATAGQYNYTPHVHGTQLFKTIYNDWFAANLPEGMIVKKKGAERYYRILPDGEKQPIKNYQVASSYVDSRNIVELTSVQLANYETTTNYLPFPDGVPMLAKWGTFYVTQNGMRHGVPSPEIRSMMGYRTEDALKVDNSGVIVQHPEGNAFTSKKLYVNGTLLRAEGESGVWYINETTKKRYAFWSPQLRDHYGINHTVVVVKRSVIDKYKFVASNPMKYRPGNLVGHDGQVFFIDYYGKRRPITNRETLDSLGFDINAVNWENEDVLKLHPLGEAI